MTAIDETTADVAFDRLHRLVGRGYVPDLGPKYRSSIYLRHPGRGPSLHLLSNGTLLDYLAEPPEGKDDWRIEPKNEEVFEAFLRWIATPTWWERNRDTFMQPIAFIAIYAIPAALVFGAIWLIRLTLGSY